ncbi:MAG: hypothetical protein P4L31_05195 [Candidatus Babeliales bacterium]|nr:hypothetical protein [Candidatus Babeliales bacterium]
MFKKMHQGLQDWWRNMAQSTWHKMSRGAEQRAKILTFAHGDNWRRKDKSQAHHNNSGHKMHKDK